MIAWDDEPRRFDDPVRAFLASAPINPPAPVVVGPMGRAWACLGDTAVGGLERWRQFRGFGTSRRAWSEILAYAAHVAEEGPDPEALCRLIRRNGLPDRPNPFPESHAQHYLFHPLGLFAADVEWVLEAWTPDADAPPDLPIEIGQWPSLAAAAWLRAHAQHRQEMDVRARARICWAMAVNTRRLDHTLRVVHPYNLLVATTDAVVRGDLKAYNLNPERVWAAARAQGIVPSISPSRLWSRLGRPTRR